MLLPPPVRQLPPPDPPFQPFPLAEAVGKDMLLLVAVSADGATVAGGAGFADMVLAEAVLAGALVKVDWYVDAAGTEEA